MNRLLLNSGPVNGVIRGLVLATSLVVCSADTSASAVRVATGTCIASGQATCTADATYNHITTSAILQGVGQVYPNSTHVQSSKATLLGSGQMSAYVLRSIPSAASVFAGVQIIAVVASTQANADMQGNTAVVASATKVQFARTIASGTAAVAWNVEPAVHRMHQAALLCQAILRVEPTVNGLALSYIDTLAHAEVVAEALCIRVAQAALQGQADGFAVGTLRQPGKSLAFASGVVITTEPVIKATLISYLDASASIQATGFIGKAAVSNVSVVANLQGNALQKHAGRSDIAGSTQLLLSAKITSKLYSVIGTQATASAQATRKLVGLAAVAGTVGIINNALRTQRATTVMGGVAQAVCVADTTVRNVVASPDASVEVIASGTVIKQGILYLVGNSEVTANAFRLLVASGEVLSGTATVYADTISNPESLDPEYRTYYRPAEKTIFVRLGTKTSFMRAT